MIMGSLVPWFAVRIVSELFIFDQVIRISNVIRIIISKSRHSLEAIIGTSDPESIDNIDSYSSEEHLRQGFPALFFGITNRPKKGIIKGECPEILILSVYRSCRPRHGVVFEPVFRFKDKRPSGFFMG